MCSVFGILLDFSFASDVVLLLFVFKLIQLYYTNDSSVRWCLFFFLPFPFHFAFCYMTPQVIFQSIWSAGMYTCPHLYNAEKWNCLGHGSEVKTEKLLLSPMNVGGVKGDYPKAVERYVRCCYDLAFLFSLWSCVLTYAICYQLG